MDSQLSKPTQAHRLLIGVPSVIQCYVPTSFVILWPDLSQTAIHHLLMKSIWYHQLYQYTSTEALTFFRDIQRSKFKCKYFELPFSMAQNTQTEASFSMLCLVIIVYFQCIEATFCMRSKDCMDIEMGKYIQSTTQHFSLYHTAHNPKRLHPPELNSKKLNLRNAYIIPLHLHTDPLHHLQWYKAQYVHIALQGLRLL